MPTMYEIYEKHAVEYDDLVRHEDYQGNLPSTLHRIHDFTHQSVIELGSGTGRLTRMLIDSVKDIRCFDRSAHMVETARENLRDYREKVSFQELDHLDAHAIQGKADVVIEGWAFGHTVLDDAENFKKTVQTLMENCEGLVRPGGRVIIIETMGTVVQEPEPPGALLKAFYDLLEGECGYSKVVVPTDYRFPSIDDAKRIMGFFFGEGIVPAIEEHNSCILPEFTGIWSKVVAP